MRYLADIRTFPRDARLGWQQDGLLGVWEQVAVRTVRRVFHWYRGALVEIDLRTVPERAVPAGVEIRPLAESDWPALREFLPERMQRHFARAQALGRRCLLAWRGDRLIGYFWWSEGSDPELEQMGLPFGPDMVYVWYLYVARPERRRNVGLALLRADLVNGRGIRGMRTAWMAIAADNRRALAVMRLFAGGGRVRVVGRLWTVRVLFWSRIRHTVHIAGGRICTVPAAPAADAALGSVPATGR